MPPFPDNPALFLDFDGTLVPFAETPDAIVVEQSVHTLLDGLHETLDGAFAMVTGRSVANLDKHLGHSRFTIAGVHGAEWRLAGESEVNTVPGDSFDDARAVIQAFAADHPDLVAEEKSGGVTLHFRRAPHLRDDARHVMEKAFGHRPDFELMSGNMMWEARRQGVDKGAAIKRLMGTQEFTNRVPIFIGDDVTDEDGFHTMNQLGGMGVKVGQGETAAAYRLDDISSVHDWLEEFARRLHETKVPT